MASLELNFVTFQQEVIKSFEDLKNEKKENTNLVVIQPEKTNDH
jgi:hypothetical protein